MKTATRFNQETHDRVRIARARRYIRTHALDGISLAAIAAEAGASPYHFSRRFSALAGETVFAYVTRVRLRHASALLAQGGQYPVTEVALAVGYQTPSAFNRVFRANLGVSPTRFRTASPQQRRRLMARLEDPRRRRPMKLKLATSPEIRVRAERPYFHVTRIGMCAEEAPGAWEALNRILAASPPPHGPDVEFIGASYDSPERGEEEAQRYDAGFTPLPGMQPLSGLTRGTVPGGRYAVFRYRGSYRHIWQAVDQIFRGWVAQGNVQLRPAPLLEVYLNDPRETAEADLLTDLCVPVA